MPDPFLRIFSEFSLSECDFFPNYPLSRLTTLRIGGPARLLAVPKSTLVLTRLLAILNEEGIARTLIGNGSNLLAPDAGYPGVVISTRALHEFEIKEQTITAGCGARLPAVARAATRAGIAGFSALSGIPGTIGGAIYMNAGAAGETVGDRILSVSAVPRDGGEPIRLLREECLFSYRKSIFMRRSLIVLSAILTGERLPVDTLLARETAALAHRRLTQPLELPSAGSVFRRPENDFAGRLIEAAGLKGLRIGGAEVSERHAGFIVNRGGATAADVNELIRCITHRVYDAFGVRLVREIEILGE